MLVKDGLQMKIKEKYKIHRRSTMLVLNLTYLMSLLQPLVILFKKILYRKDFSLSNKLLLFCRLLKPFHVKTLCLIKLLFMELCQICLK